MKTSILALVAASVTVACSGMVTANDGSRVTVEHDFFISTDSAQAVAVSSCKQVGKASARHVTTVNKNPRFAPGQGVQLSTFQCE